MNEAQQDRYRGRLDIALDSLTEAIVGEISTIFVSARLSGDRIWLIGNGGSATTADHFATDLLRFSGKEGRPVRATSLGSNVGVITATSHDLGYEQIFTRQLEILASPGDVWGAISATGNSPNIIAAINWARQNSLVAVGLTGFDGGAARALVDVSVHVESAKGDYGVEDAHLVACHMVAEALRVDQIPYASEG